MDSSSGVMAPMRSSAAVEIASCVPCPHVAPGGHTGVGRGPRLGASSPPSPMASPAGADPSAPGPMLPSAPRLASPPDASVPGGGMLESPVPTMDPGPSLDPPSRSLSLGGGPAGFDDEHAQTHPPTIAATPPKATGRNLIRKPRNRTSCPNRRGPGSQVAPVSWG